MLLSDFCARLEAATGLDVYPGHAPESASAPFVIYNQTSCAPLRALDGSTGTLESIFRVDAYHQSFGSAEALAGQIIAALDDWKDEGMGVLSSSLEVRRNLSDLTHDPALSRVQAEFRILHR